MVDHLCLQFSLETPDTDFDQIRFIRSLCPPQGHVWRIAPVAAAEHIKLNGRHGDDGKKQFLPGLFLLMVTT